MWHQDINWACQRTVFHLCPTLPELPTFSESQPAPTCSVGSRGAPCTNHRRWPLGDNTSCIPKNAPSLATCCLVYHCPTLMDDALLFWPVTGYPVVEATPSNRFDQTTTHFPPADIDMSMEWSTPSEGITTKAVTHPPPPSAEALQIPPYRCFLPCKRRPPSGSGETRIAAQSNVQGVLAIKNNDQQKNPREHAKMHSLVHAV